jgi:hypothetical protein
MPKKGIVSDMNSGLRETHEVRIYRWKRTKKDYGYALGVGNVASYPYAELWLAINDAFTDKPLYMNGNIEPDLDGIGATLYAVIDLKDNSLLFKLPEKQPNKEG